MILLKGLGTRIRTLTMEAAMGQTSMVWPNDQHCPVDVADVFPNGIPGIDLKPLQGRVHCPRGPIIGCAAAWKLVWGSFENVPLEQYPCGIHFRGFHSGGKAWDVFAEDVKRFADTMTGKVFVLADSRRDEIRAILGDRMVDPSAKPLDFDFDRSPEQVLAHLRDWRTFVLTTSAISSHPRPAAMWARMMQSSCI